MHAILPLISSNWHSSGQRDPTFSPWTSPVPRASAPLHLQQSFANQPSEEIISSCLHFSSQVTTTSQPHLAGLKMRHLFGQRQLRNKAERERGLCVHDLYPHKQQDSQYLHQELSYPFCQPTSAHSSWTRPEKGVALLLSLNAAQWRFFLTELKRCRLETVKIKHASGNSEFKSFPTQKVSNPLICLTNASAELPQCMWGENCVYWLASVLSKRWSPGGLHPQHQALWGWSKSVVTSAMTLAEPAHHQSRPTLKSNRNSLSFFHT